MTRISIRLDRVGGDVVYVVCVHWLDQVCRVYELDEVGRSVRRGSSKVNALVERWEGAVAGTEWEGFTQWLSEELVKHLGVSPLPAMGLAYAAAGLAATMGAYPFYEPVTYPEQGGVTVLEKGDPFTRVVKILVRRASTVLGYDPEPTDLPDLARGGALEPFAYSDGTWLVLRDAAMRAAATTSTELGTVLELLDAKHHVVGTMVTVLVEDFTRFATRVLQVMHAAARLNQSSDALFSILRCVTCSTHGRGGSPSQ